MYLPSHFFSPLLSKDNFMGWDKDILMKQKQRSCMEAKKNKRFVLYFPSASPATSWAAGLQHSLWFLQMTNTGMNSMLCLLSLRFYCSADTIWYGISFGSDVLAVSLPKTFPTPSQTGEGRNFGETVLVQSQLCSAGTKTVTSTPLQPSMPSPAMWRLPWEKLNPSLSDPRYLAAVILNQRVKGALSQIMYSVWKHCTTRISENKKVHSLASVA